MPAKTLATCLALACLGALSMAATANAASIVYQGPDGNVWLVNPETSQQHRVTSDGTAADPYESPSQADDGTIVVERGSGSEAKLYRMDQGGNLLNAPVSTPAPGTGALDPRLSPNGQLVAYWFVGTIRDPNCTWCIETYSQTFYSRPDRLTGHDEIGPPYCCYEPSWMGNEAIFLTNGSATAWYHRLGTPEAQQWFSDSATMGAEVFEGFHDAELSRGGNRIALVRGDSEETIQLYELSGPAPTKPKPGCAFINPVGRFESPTWSPDGSALAWSENDGISIRNVPSVSDCDAINAAGPGKFIAGAKKPNWGPADINPPQGGGGGGGGGGAPDTVITKGPKNGVTNAKLTFRSTQQGSTFECKLDKAKFKGCTSPYKKKVDDGKHKFFVRATGPSGETDPTPARWKWKA